MADPNENPETAAITGGVPAAAEPSPQTRGRLASAQASTFILIVLGVVLLLTAALADQDSDATIGLVVLAVALLAIGAMSVTGFLPPVAIAGLGFVAGALATILAFSTDDFGGAQLVLLITGAATFISSFASLAASRRPSSGDEEPSAGVENV
jgi:hypothetical protein